MYHQQFLRYERLKAQLQNIKGLCPDQYFSINKCSSNVHCGRTHVDRCFYPCIHFYTGNCKYGFNCLFSHSIKRVVVRPAPEKEACKKLYYDGTCPMGNKCSSSHNLRNYPCVYNSISKCKFSADHCRYSHEKKLESPVLCFFNLMNGCHNQQCENKHLNENFIKYISYEGPL